ncbi:integrase catalytic domain-containing protein [Nephila pilipes]|uniref:Integrase catalytic domain-containing protein n=1 Tax=Nephila pilipes TaxID=299642 RepID=A0A8X6N114_NEPPI|nr:integrase catalytic domain-containing protein [Nephila pilipes]
MALRLEISKTYFWSDSKIVLSWIKKQSSQLKTFVANRVTKIQDLSCDEQWCYVSLVDNPADLISPGVNPSKLLESHLWWGKLVSKELADKEEIVDPESSL